MREKVANRVHGFTAFTHSIQPCQIIIVRKIATIVIPVIIIVILVTTNANLANIIAIFLTIVVIRRKYKTFIQKKYRQRNDNLEFGTLFVMRFGK